MKHLAAYQKYLPGLAWVAFCSVTLALRLWHEPWRDEADAWLMARDASVAQVFGIASFSGTPVLWYLVQMPFAKLGLPYETQGFLNLAFLWLAAALLLFRSTLPILMRVVVVSSYFLVFEYAVIARNYGLGTLILFLIAATDKDRFRRPLFYGALIAALANVSAHFMFMAAAVALGYLIEAVSTRQIRSAASGLVVSGLGIVLSVVSLWPRPGGQFEGTIVAGWHPGRFAVAINDWINPHFKPVSLYLGVLSLVAVAIALVGSRRALLMFGAGLTGIFYILLCKYYGGSRHAGMIFLWAVFSLWVGSGDSSSSSSHSRLRRAALICACVLAAVPSSLRLPRTWRLERIGAYSASGEMANYLLTTGLHNREIAAHHAAMTSAVLPFLPGKKRFWYPGIQDFGSHMLWDSRYMAGYAVSADEAARRTKERFGEQAPGNEAPLLLLSQPLSLSNPAASGYSLLFRTKRRIWGIRDESYFLYAPVQRTR